MMLVVLLTTVHVICVEDRFASCSNFYFTFTIAAFTIDPLFFIMNHYFVMRKTFI